jgi:carbonic anhydrase/acetyltransferase-like protein (isoleucine patch superfamily)
MIPRTVSSPSACARDRTNQLPASFLDSLKLLFLKSLCFYGRLKLHLLQRLHPGLHIHPKASPCFAMAEFRLAPGAELHIDEGVVTEWRSGALRFDLGEGARVHVGCGAWLRTDAGPLQIVAFPGAQIEVGPRAFLNGCYLSAKEAVTLGERAFVGMGSRIFDADQHDLDAERLEQVEPVILEEHVWVASDATVLRGVRIGAHSVVGTRSVVTRSVPAHTLVAGVPAKVLGSVGDRSGAR